MPLRNPANRHRLSESSIEVAIRHGCLNRAPYYWSRYISSLSLLFLLFSIPQTGNAQEARDYSNAPVDTILVETLNTYDNSNTISDQTIPTDSQTRSFNSTLFSEYVFPEPNGHTAGVGFLIPYQTVSGYNHTTGLPTVQYSNLADMAIVFDWNIYGAHALPKSVFRETPPTTYGGIHFVFTLPTGSYSPKNPYNAGNNRFEMTTVLQQTFVLDKGRTQFDVWATGKFFTDNHAYRGSNVLSENPDYIGTFLFSQNFSTKDFASVGATYNTNGSSAINGVTTGRPEHNWQAVFGLALHPVKECQLYLSWVQSLAPPPRTPNVKQAQLVFEYLAGGKP